MTRKLVLYFNPLKKGNDSKGESFTVKTPICEEYGIEFPIFAFSHSPDGVAAVSKTGGMGVLGASGMSPEELDQAGEDPARMRRN